jgi:hypothetical protein
MCVIDWRGTYVIELRGMGVIDLRGMCAVETWRIIRMPGL